MPSLQLPAVGRVAFGPPLTPLSDLDRLARSHAGAYFTPTQVVTPQDKNTVEFWAARLDEASSRVSDAKWHRGDMLIEARRVLGDRWTQLLDLDTVKVSESTLRQELWISSRFPAGDVPGRRRVTGVDWSQHRLVAADDIAPGDAMRLLSRSAREAWSYDRMESAVRELRGRGAPGGDMPDPTALDRREYVDAVVANRCGDVPPVTRKLVLAAAFAAVDEWERARGAA